MVNDILINQSKMKKTLSNQISVLMRLVSFVTKYKKSNTRTNSKIQNSLAVELKTNDAVSGGDSVYVNLWPSELIFELHRSLFKRKHTLL